jgi:hypothetical protein
MRERGDIHALFSNNAFGPIPQVGGRIKDLDWQPLQVSTVYPVRAWTEKQAAHRAWELLVSGSRFCTEWYDGSPDGRWTQFFTCK